MSNDNKNTKKSDSAKESAASSSKKEKQADGSLKKIDKEKEKKANEKGSKKAAAAKRPRRSVIRYFKETRAEFKKVTWPAPKQVANNTAVVLTMLVIAGMAIWGLDKIFETFFTFILNVE